MYRTRAVVQGRMAEIFGHLALPIDKFARTIGYHRNAKATYEVMSEENLKIYHAYADGVNDFVDNLGLIDGQSGRLLPPEFYLLGITPEKWHPIDSMAISQLIQFGLAWDWALDYIRELIKLEAGDELAEILIPYIIDYTADGHDMWTVFNDEDLQKMGLPRSEKTLSQRAHENRQSNKRAEPKRVKNNEAVP